MIQRKTCLFLQLEYRNLITEYSNHFHYWIRLKKLANILQQYEVFKETA